MDSQDEVIGAESLAVSGRRIASPLHRQVTEVFRLYREPVFRYSLGILRDPAEAEDATQEAFLRLYRELKDGRRIEYRPWLFRVAHNLAIDRIRQQSSTAVMDNEGWNALEETTSDAGAGTQHQLLKREQRERLAKASRRLSENERRCIDLRMEGLRYREIADVLGVRISSVESHISRAVRKIVRELDA